MPIIKISDLVEKTTPADSDLLVIVDVSTNATKKVTRTNLFKNPPLPASSITTTMLNDASVTTAKVNDAAITPAKLLAGTGTTWPYASYTPTFTNFTLGNGTLAASYRQIGKLVHFKISITLGTTSSVSAGTDFIFTLPVTSVSTYTQYFDVLGMINLRDTSAATGYVGTANWYSTTQGVLQRFIVSGSAIVNDNVDSDEPFVWASTDQIKIEGTYEAA